MMKKLNQDKITALLFLALTIIFLVVSMTNASFFQWAFERHHNPWSWYIRPLFLIPFCFFAYKRSWSGVSATIFLLFTSMFWFNRPTEVSAQVMEFLQFEKDWLYGAWNFQKILLILTVPISFFALGLAFWKRSLLMGLGVVVLMATGKIIWSIQNAGESGKSIVIPALLGLGICSALIYWGFRRLEKKNANKN
jgi:hypothetical protein